MTKIVFVFLMMSLMFFSLCLGSGTDGDRGSTMESSLTDDQIDYCQAAAKAGTCNKLEEISMLVSPEECCEALGACCKG